MTKTVKVIKAIHTGIVVSDIDRSIDFYRHGLGLEVSEKICHQGKAVAQLVGADVDAVEIAFVSLPNWEIELLQYHEARTRRASNLMPSDIGCMHLSLEVANLDDALYTLATAGFSASGSVLIPDKGPRKGRKIVYTRDPDGTVIELVQMPN